MQARSKHSYPFHQLLLTNSHTCSHAQLSPSLSSLSFFSLSLSLSLSLSFFLSFFLLHLPFLYPTNQVTHSKIMLLRFWAHVWQQWMGRQIQRRVGEVVVAAAVENQTHLLAHPNGFAKHDRLLPEVVAGEAGECNLEQRQSMGEGGEVVGVQSAVPNEGVNLYEGE